MYAFEMYDRFGCKDYFAVISDDGMTVYSKNGGPRQLESRDNLPSLVYERFCAAEKDLLFKMGVIESDMLDVSER